MIINDGYRTEITRDTARCSEGAGRLMRTAITTLILTITPLIPYLYIVHTYR